MHFSFADRIRWKSLVHSLWVIVPLALMVGLSFSEMFVFDVLEDSIGHYERKIGNLLREKEITACWDFEGTAVSERVADFPVYTEGTGPVPGRHGNGRVFFPERNGVIKTSASLSTLGTNYTITFWLKVRDPDYDQRILRYFTVDSGELVFEVSGQSVPCRSRLPAGKWTHVAGVADISSEEVRLYLDGKLKDTRDLEEPWIRHERVIIGQVPGANPSDFTMDELVFWKKDLDPAEIAGARDDCRSIVGRFAGSAALKLKILRAVRDACSSVVTFADSFNPFYHETTVMRADIPHWSLGLSRSDENVFVDFERNRLMNGINMYATSDRRTIDLAVDGLIASGRMELVCSQTENILKRKSFTIERADPGTDNLHETFLFEPPERYHFVPHLLAVKLARTAGYPAQFPTLCSVTINGHFDGAYFVRVIGDGMDHYSLAGPDDWKTRLSALPFANSEILAEFDRLADKTLPILLADRKRVRNSLELSHMVRLQREAVEEVLRESRGEANMSRAALVKNYIDEHRLLGGNPAPGYIVENLDFSPASVRGTEVSYKSLTPELVADDGKIMRPERRSAEARIRVTVKNGTDTESKDLKFTLIPENLEIRAVRINIGGQLSADRRVPCGIQTLDNAGASRSEWLCGRIKWRGNTSLVKARKKYFSVKLDGFCRLPDFRDTRFIKLTSGYRDPTMMHDKLAYDLFRSFGDPGKPRYAPACELIDLIINDTYHGVYSMTDRIDAELLGFSRGPGRDGRRSVIYKIGSDYSRRKPYVQRWPDEMDGEYWEPYDELMEIIHESSSEEFARTVEKKIDIGNVIDYALLVNFTSNAEGSEFWTYIARGARPDSRFFFVPWDFDMTFRPGRWNENDLTLRLEKHLPGYRKRLSERYRELRRNQLSEASLMKRISRIENRIADSMKRNMKRWNLPPRKEFHLKVEEMRQCIKERLELMDGRLLDEDSKSDEVVSSTP